MTPRLPACQSGTRHPDTWHSNHPAEQAEARAVCLACPRRPVCHAMVLAAERGWPAADRHGIWAGLDGEQRAALDPTAPAAPAEPPAGRPDVLRENAAWLIAVQGYTTEGAARQLRVTVRHLLRTLAADGTRAAA